MSSMLVIAFAVLQAAQALPASPTQEPEIVYEIAFPNRLHHEANVTVTFTGLRPQAPLELRMSRVSPGRYALHEFAKNVYSVKAVDGNGRELPIHRPNEHQWDVTGHNGTVRVTYTLFGDHADGTYVGIDNTHAHLNMPATFMFARGLDDRPIRVTFRVPDNSNWKVATQLKPTNDPFTFTAPNFQYFMDSPTEISNWTVREWQRSGQTIRLVVHHQGTDAQVDQYADLAKRVVAEQEAIFGELPRFDYGVYTFLADYLPWVYGDGMEHRNSTILTSTGSLQNPTGLLNTLSHEFFHAWNMERLRSAMLEPFDFERTNMSRELWLGEGFTNYYGPLAIHRAGIMPLEQYLNGLASGLNAVINGPGRRYFSPVEMSMQAPFVDAARSVDIQNKVNTFISYYTWGAAIGLGLDLSLRTEKNASLDEYMRELWRRHGKPEKPYTMNDLRLALGAVARDQAWADNFFARYIEGRDVVDYEALLGRAGLLLRKARPGTPVLGLSLAYENGRAIVDNQTLVGTAAYEAGIDLGDRIVSINGRPIRSAEDFNAAIANMKVGTALEFVVEQRGETRTVRVVPKEDARLELVTYESANLPVTDAMKRLRDAWLGSKTRS